MPDYILPDQRRSLISTRVRWWGIPITMWVIFGIWIASGSDDTPQAASEQSTDTPAPAQSKPQASTTSTAPAAKQTKPAQPTKTLYRPFSFDKAKTGKLNLKAESGCRSAIIVDADTRQVIWHKGAHTPVPIASMTKMMTLLLAEESRQIVPELTLETPIKVTKAAYDIGGSQVWLDPKETFSLGELLKSIAIKSANDSAYLVGEFLGGGDITAFVKRMNVRAKEIGMKNTIFYNSHGLETNAKQNNTSSAYDMVVLGERLLVYPEIMNWCSTKLDTFRNGQTELKNHNNLVFRGVPGVDGLKTGYTSKSGFCVTISCKRQGRRLLACVTGYKNYRDRDAFCTALLNWAYNQPE